MLFLTDDATILCGHAGRCAVGASQRWVTVQGRPLLVATDPEGKGISGCPFLAGGQPCVGTAEVSRGYSTLVRIDGRPVCRADVEGPTLPLRVAHYTVARPGQSFVSETP
ncbi:MAG TPA: hypothetical protein VGH20_06970 [Myxococcales bacterium]|jgi:hypothetical protein